MLHPTIDELTKGKYNRYELALATARCARLVTDEYVRQHDAAEKSITGNKETDKPLNTMIDKELRDEKAVKVAVGRIFRGEYEIDEEAALPKAEEETADVAEEMTEETAEETAEEETADAAEDTVEEAEPASELAE